jgi:diguanylate cyclase (GGDEF)-like protein
MILNKQKRHINGQFHFLSTQKIMRACALFNNLAILRVRALEKLNATAPERESLANAAFAFITEGFSRNAQTVNSVMLVAALSNTRGDLLATLGRLDESLIDINQSLAAYRKIALPRGEADALTNLGEAYLRLGQLDLALAQLHEAWRIISAHALKDHERPLQQLFATVYERSGNPTQALTHFKLFHQLEIEHQHRDTQKKLQQMALRAEIDAAIADAQRERLRAIDLADRNQALDRMAHEDALTGVANRRRLDEWVETQPISLPSDIAVALIDIDHFKQINDQYSHALGDAVLRSLGAILRVHTRANDLAARYGGEEFVLVLTNVSAKQMAERMERLRTAIEQQNWFALHPTLRVTASVGIAVADGTQGFKKLIESADAALYDAKRNGRNRVQIFHATAA